MLRYTIEFKDLNVLKIGISEGANISKLFIAYSIFH